MPISLAKRLFDAHGPLSLAAIVSGALLVLSFPPFDYSWLAWFAPTLFLYGLTRSVTRSFSWRAAWWAGWLLGWVFFFFSTNWITYSMMEYGGMPAVPAYLASALFSAVVAVFPALFAVIMAWLLCATGPRALWLAPFVWVMSEWLRGVITGVTWNALGISQVDNRFPVACATFGGVWLVSGALVAAAALPVWLWENRFLEARLRHAVVLILLLFAGPATFLLSSSEVSERLPGALYQHHSVPVLGVQPNVPLTIYHSPNGPAEYFDGTLRLTRQTLAQSPLPPWGAGLIVWSESPLVLNYEQDPYVKQQMDALTRETGYHVIFSALARDGDSPYNSAQTLAPDPDCQAPRQLTRYDKMRLVPFGEYVPLRPVLGYFVPPMVGDFHNGKEPVVNSLSLKTSYYSPADGYSADTPNGLVRPGTFICYEAAYPNLVRQFVRNGATLLVNISNDAWFGNTEGARQHLAHARMRAIENNRDLVRVTNSGVSALITGRGRVVDELPQFQATAQIWHASLNEEMTFYTRHGDWFPMLCALVTLLAMGYALMRQRTRTRA
ncbi:MAG: apolipoprotein N-acyltransferase [Blastocatellia bacterium]